jgi:tRNA (mo5U34)-methyltransferase
MPGERLAGDPRFEKIIQDQVAYLSERGWFHSIELPGGGIIKGFHSIEELREQLSAFPIPQDLAGKRVLDVGAWTGWYSFELERRGADVVAMDCVDLAEFQMARRLVGSKVELCILDVDELSPETAGRFDYVLFFGVLYHLRNPLAGLERICSVTREAAFVESYVTDGPGPPPSLEFYETTELGGQIDNWWGPNTNCLLAMCRSAGFARVRLEGVAGNRARVTCWRHWEPPDPSPSQPAPWIHAAINNRTNDIYFHHGKDEYVCLYFKTPERGLTLDQIRVEIDGFGVPSLVLADLGRDGWQANLRIPPWLDAGPHEVRVRTLHSASSDGYRIEKRMKQEPALRAGKRRVGELPPESATEPAPVLTTLENSVTETKLFRGYRNECLISWFTTPEAGLTRDDVILEIDGVEEPALFLTDLRGGAWQINSRLPAGLAQGTHTVRVRTVRSGWSNEEEFLLTSQLC